MNLDPREIELRHQTYAWARERFLADEPAAAGVEESRLLREEQAGDALALVDRLRVTGDIVAFKEQLNVLTSPKSSRLGLSGPNGQMVVNQVANNAPDPTRAAHIVAEVLAAPVDEQEAVAKIQALAGYFTEISTGNQLQLGRAAPLASAFWALARPDTWPALWPTALTAFEQLGWHLPDDHAERYLAFRSVILELGTPWDVLLTLRWLSECVWSAADPTLRGRIDWAWELKEQGVDDLEPAFENADAINAPLRKAGDDLIPAISRALDRDVTKRLAPRKREERGEQKARFDGYVTWSPPGKQEGWQTMPGLRLWFGVDGVLVGLHPGYREKGWIDHIRALLTRERLPERLEILDYYRVQRSRLQAATQNDFFVGRFWSYDDFDWDGAADEVVEVASNALPVLQQVLVEGPAWSRSADSEMPAGEVDDQLRARFIEFKADTGYPSTHDKEQQAAREVMAATLAKGALDAMDVAEFRRIMNTNKYGFAGFRSVLNSTLADPDQDAVQELVTEVVGDLLYGPGDFADRLDRCPKRLKGLGQAGAMRLLAIVYPDRFLPIYPLTGTSGKLALLPFVAVSEMPTGSIGERAVEANDALRARLGSIPELAEDPWGQMVFAYWLRDRATSPESDNEAQSLESRLAAATEACTLPPDSTFLGQLVSLLEDKGQIVLYGPPGTGKTYLALELAAALAPDEERRALVQFHPSTAYEDFMEGFRPVLKQEGLTYQLTEGPLIEMANRAALDPRPHVLVIDEMNRANLPKVFGELLFLLEYRGRPVKLAYRANEDSFSLPENLWIIGTMNLADRSVGQIDAALRRRFAFVPFTPNDEQNGGLLRRWLEKKHLPVWPADVVDEVNSQLETDLGHADLLIGPSYFMKEDLDEARMATIWRYAIEPLMSDVFHGDEALVKKYTWTAVAKRYAPYLPGGDGGAIEEPGDATVGSETSPHESDAVS